MENDFNLNEIKDRESEHPNRKRLRIISQTPNEIVADIEHADNATEPGTPINKTLINKIIGEVKKLSNEIVEKQGSRITENNQYVLDYNIDLKANKTEIDNLSGVVNANSLDINNMKNRKADKEEMCSLTTLMLGNINSKTSFELGEKFTNFVKLLFVGKNDTNEVCEWEVYTDVLKDRTSGNMYNLSNSHADRARYMNIYPTPTEDAQQKYKWLTVGGYENFTLIGVYGIWRK